MAPITAELNAFHNEFHSTAPKELSGTIQRTTDDFVAKFDPSKAIQVGDKLPAFKMTDATGKEVDSAELLANGPILINFYRGSWCPFCNIALHGFQEKLEEITAKGVTLVAITPELPDGTLSLSEKHALKFPVLSDVGNVFAKKLNILYAQTEEMRPVFGMMKVDLKATYGDDKMEVPVPATILVDRTGTVRNTFIDADFVHRLEPATALEWIDAL